MGLIGRVLEPLRQLRHRAHADDLANDNGGAAAIRAWRAVHGEKVVTGPFAGMQYPARWGDASAPAKWLGSYEEEIAPAITQLIDRQPDLVVIIGSADGYYSVGMARRLPHARVEAFDTEWIARRNTARLASANGVSTVAVHGTATRFRLAEVLRSGARRPLVISDCEGAEDSLIDPAPVPSLASCDLLIELHEREQPALGNRIAARFPTHRHEFIHTRDRDVTKYPALEPLSAELRSCIVREFRYAQRFLVLTASR
jgi:hypothetical protein